MPMAGFQPFKSFGAAGSAGLAGRAASHVPAITPEEEESIARRISRKTIGGVAAVGNLLDLPGSMVRDVAATVTSGKWHNPFDQLLSPLSDDNRVRGRDLLRQWGMAGKKDTWGNLAGGIGAEIALDPLTYLLPFGALTKAGKFVQKAGLSGDVIDIASRAAKTPVARLGPREAAMRTTMKDVLRAVAGTPKETALRTAASKAGVNLAELADQPLRGAFGMGLFSKPLHVTGFGPRGMAYSKKLDDLGRTIRFGKIPGTQFAPGEKLNQLFNVKINQAVGATGQYFAKKGWLGREALRSSANLEIAKAAKVLEKHGWAKDTMSDTLLSVLEHPTGRHPAYLAAHPEVKEVVDSLQQFKDSVRKMVIDEGGEMGEYVSPLAKHWPRYGARDEAIPSGAATSKSFSAFMQSEKSRAPIFGPHTDKAGVVHAIADETNTIRKMISDADIDDLITRGKSVDEIADLIKAKYGSVIPENFTEPSKVLASGKLVSAHTGNRYKALAHWVANMKPEFRKAGYFADNPLASLHTYAVQGYTTVGGLRAIREYMTSPGVLQAPSFAADQTGMKTLREALEGVAGKVNADTMAGKIHAQMWQAMSSAEQKQHLADVLTWVRQTTKKPNAALDHATDLAKYTLASRVDDATAGNIGRIMTGFTSPKPVSDVVKALDSITGFWKGWQTSAWPAFHMRNFVSGQVQNWISGTWSAESCKMTWDLLRGKTVKGATNLPAVQQLARSRGITNLTDEIATDLLGEMAYAHNMTGKYAGEAMARTGLDTAFQPQTMENLLTEIPRRGFQAASPARTAQRAIFRHPGVTFNPLHARGIGGRTKTEFGWMAAGEDIAQATEGMNRIAPFIHQLKEGIDPATAAAKVGRQQVMYDSRYFTPLEREVLQRLAPFYKFSSRMPVWAINELAARPGGKLAQLIRGTSALRDPSAMTPEYVQQTTSIPMGRSPDGTERYLTGLGLMHEDPASFLTSGGPGQFLRGAGLEALSRTHPLPKGLLEWSTGQSLFQRGPMGGRQLEDLDPTIGRLIANLTGREKAVKIPGGEGAEHIAANLIGRPLTTMRTMTYPIRDRSLGEGARTAANLLTGFRVTKVRPGAQDAMLREHLSRLMKDVGGKTFVRSYIPEDVEAEMVPQEREDAQKLEALMHLLSMRAKARREAEQANR